LKCSKKEIEDDHNNKPRTKLYKQEVLTALNKSWPELYSADIAKISRKDCNEWAARYGKEYSPPGITERWASFGGFSRLPSSMAIAWIIPPSS
jgi:hypothetical protein